MAKEYAKKFYQSTQWKETRESYLKKQHYLCERCLCEVADVVHHKTYITASNINNYNITLNEKNLEALCSSCHNKEHKHKKGKKRYVFDVDGNIALPPI